MSFSLQTYFPGVTHIMDSMGVCMTLLAGKREALLVDTGYGLENVAAQARALTGAPLDVLITHGHHDHALGAMWFPRVFAFPEEEPVYQTYTDEKWRRHVLEGAEARGLVPVEGWLRRPVPSLTYITEGERDFGGLTVRVFRCPGHTPGSAVVYVPEHRLLLTGDDWNPTTWCFFPEACPVREHLARLRELMALPFEHVLCSHRQELFPRAMLEAFLAGMTEEALLAAEPSPEGEAQGIRTARAVLSDGQTLVFDRDKL